MSAGLKPCMCKSASACFINGGCLDRGTKWEVESATPATAELVEGPPQLTKLNLDTPEFRALSAALSPEQRENLAVYIRTRAHGYARDAIASDRASRDQQPAVDLAAQGMSVALRETSDRLGQFAAENTSLRMENEDLRAQLARQSRGEQFGKFDLTDYSVAVNYSNGTSTPVLPITPQPAPARFGESVGDDEVPLPRAINEVHFANGAPQHFMEYTAGQAVYSTEQMRQYARAYHANMMRKLGGEAGKVYAECRECKECGHVGINDSNDTLAACHNCDWSGPSPIEDHCPGCADNGTMGAACPKCGALYQLLAEAYLAPKLTHARTAGVNNNEQPGEQK